ncbi:NAD(P)-dependent oxidoreductase [Ideonella sp.]|uniref:NAD(P)-dependent oxidoreductase n=1 Tax=Ideonella sp. TaxID=1929293 RepID=UPI002B4A2901|nr:NAD(P)-dependent oxidoreductase [Ideonella sp.]HJV69028.1 NAD(P)-dependent oxidoreductase [Ideonella sp.]
MKIALIGATGFVGSKVLAEALQRGHHVTALARTPSKLAPRAGLAVVAADGADASAIAQAVAGHDALVSTYNVRGQADFAAQYLRGARAAIEGCKRAGVQRLLWVGGAGSLFVAPGVQLVDTPQFPAEYKTEARAARDALGLFRDEAGLEWSFVSPAPMLVPGERTGRFRLGGDEVLMDAGQPGRISVEDLAVAILDELESPQHVRRRFTLAY